MTLDFGMEIRLHRPEALQKVRGIANPYDYSTHRLEANDFIGRSNHLIKFTNLLEDHNKGNRLKNVTIIGNKSYGKSTLLHRLKQILQNYEFVVYETELYRNSPHPIDEFELFKNIINHIFDNFAPIPDSCLDTTQQDIWYSLTLQGFSHSSKFVERKTGFGTFYSNVKQGLPQSLPYDVLERDFISLVEALTNKGSYKGVAILIDEFQELERNTELLDMLRKLSDCIPSLMVIGAGLPPSLQNTSFDKFIRTSLAIRLEKLEEMEILELIYRPIESKASLTRFEVQDIFDQKTMNEIVNRSGGNPLDIKILCSKIFECFVSNPDSKNLMINIEVMKEAMLYYASVSEKSMKIKNALETCTREQLQLFKKLYYYECLSIRSILWLLLAFGSLTPDREEVVRNEIIADLTGIYEFGLFELRGNVQSIHELQTLSPVALSQVSYCFIGDTIDKLYASYFFEELTKERLLPNNNRSFEDMLTKKLADLIADGIKEKIAISCNVGWTNFTRIDPGILQRSFDYDEVARDYQALAKIDKDAKDKEIDQIRELTKKYDLRFPATIAVSLDLDGYYVLSSDVSVKGKKRIISTFFPMKSYDQDSSAIPKQIIDHASYLNYSLSDYMVNVDKCVLFWLSKEALLNVILVDISNESSLLMKKVKERDFGGAHESARRILSKGFKITPNGIVIHQNWFNNYGFCLINIGDTSFAKKIFEDLKDKNIFAKINLSYVMLLEENWMGAKALLKDLFKKHYKNPNEHGVLHLAIMHPKLPNHHRIVEEITLVNVVLWNLSLISSKYENNINSAIAFHKKTILKNNSDHIISQRVKNWIYFFLNNRKDALDGAQKTLSKCDSASNMHLDLSKDLEIFSSTND
jgi:hypothetical protein